MAKPTVDTIAVFTQDPVDEIVAKGGSGDWVLNPERARHCTYLVCCRKKRWKNMEEQILHRAAFLVGRIRKLVPRDGEAGPRGQKRYFIEMSDYAPVNKPNAWKKWQNPVTYTSLEILGINVKELEFKPVDVRSDVAAPQGAAPEHLTIAQAKSALAKTFGVPSEDIEIIIRG